MKNILKYFSLSILSILIIACGGSGGGGSNPSPSPAPSGTLAFNKTAITVTTGSTQTVVLSFSSTAANASANVDLSSANSQIATVSPATCALTNSTTSGSSCQITVHGVANGSTTITASAAGYTSITATATVSSAAVPGNIIFANNTTPIFVGESSSAFVILDGSSGVSGETVSLSSNNPAISVTPSCSLSTANNYCQITLNASESATATITATSTTSGESSMQAIASRTATVGTLTITPGSVLIAAQSGSQSNPATITLANSAGVHNLWVSVAGNTNANVASPGNITQNNIPVGYCCLSSNPESNTCNFNAVGGGSAGTTTISWQAVANGQGGSCPSMGANYSAYSQPALNVTAASIVPTARTFNIVNNCGYTVYFGISGGAVGNSASSQADCPANSTYAESQATCFWNNPTPTGSNYTLSANGGSTSLTIPASNYNGQEWSGGIAGRTNCTESGLCETGGCTGTSPGTGGTSGLACAVSHGFSIPNSAAEFTLLNNGNDAYDVTLIGGVIVPVSMQPSNNAIVSTASPYQCGNAGSATAQYGFFNGTPQTLYAANWIPNVPATSGTSVATPAQAYNYVSGTSASNTSCSTGSSGSYQPNASACTAPGASGTVCGYTYDAINQPSPTYQYTCGSRIGWISAATIYAANSTNNLAPFDFNLAPNPSGSNPNGYTIGQWSQCVHPPFDSSYQVGSPDAQTCGGTNWVGIATPESGFMSSNLVWQQEILTRITWIKQACPTCYSYQFDDNSSSFTCQTSAGSTNPANATNYTVTFCPAN